MTSRTAPPRRSPGVDLPPFMEVLTEHRDVVYRFLRAAAGPDADDCFQETFLAALRAYPRLRSADNLRSWLLTIARRKAIDEHRGRARRPVPSERLPDGAVDPSTEAEDGLWQAVRTLPPKQRAAVLYRFVADLPHREIAAALGCSEEAARRSVHEGLKKLREVWA